MSDKVEKIGETQLNSIIDDPFTKEALTDIDVHYTYSAFNGWYAWGNVEFTKNKTSGKIRFDGKTFDDVTRQIKTFIENEL